MNKEEKRAGKITRIADIVIQMYLEWNTLIQDIGQSIKIHLQGYRTAGGDRIERIFV